MATAAELLRKGGTLLPEPCSACKGVQVKYSGKVVCVNCGKEEEVVVKKAKAPTEEKARPLTATINEARVTIVAKINELLPMLKSERDLGRQSEIAKLLMHYLEVLEKIPKETESTQ